MAKRTVVGLDMSLTSTGAVAIKGHTGLLGKRSTLRGWQNPLTSLKDGDDQDRILMIIETILPWVLDQDPDLVIIERYALSRYTNQSRLGELGGVIRWELTKSGYPWVSVVAGSVKLHATGSGRADKKLMLASARDFWEECPNHDVADAFHLARWGLDKYSEIMVRLAGRLHYESLE